MLIAKDRAPQINFGFSRKFGGIDERHFKKNWQAENCARCGYRRCNRC